MSPGARLADAEGEAACVEEAHEESAAPASRSRRAADGWTPARLTGEGHQRSLALGLLAMLPMFLAYELALAHDPALLRSHSELALLRAVEPLGDGVTIVRRGLLVVLVPVSIVVCFRLRIALLPSLVRIFFEGLVGAMLLGPVLAFGVRLLGGVSAEIAESATRAVDPGLDLAARIFGGAAYEELLFRVLLYGGVYFLARRVALFFGVGAPAAPWAAEVLAVLASATVFAAAHLTDWNRWLGPGGEPFDAAIFTWRLLAGILLAILFRWRGPGVAAWTHGLFNLALLIGAGPSILL